MAFPLERSGQMDHAEVHEVSPSQSSDNSPDLTFDEQVSDPSECQLSLLFCCFTKCSNVLKMT